MKKVWLFVAPITLVLILAKFQGATAEPLQAVPGFSSKGKNAQGLPEYTHRKTGIVFVRLLGGQFSMGSPPTETGRIRDEKLHRVSLSPFLIAKYEVTRTQWKKVMGKNPSYRRGEVELLSIGDDHPAANIGLTETMEFLSKAGLKLPTEAQWEYACRAGSSGMFSPSDLNQAGWYDANSGKKPRPVGKKNPNGFGLYDMHGNVLEPCRDVYDPGYYSKAAASGKDPVNLVGKTLPEAAYVVRGGSCAKNRLNCRAAQRTSLYFPDDEYPRIDANWFTGLRPVYDLR